MRPLTRTEQIKRKLAGDRVVAYVSHGYDASAGDDMRHLIAVNECSRQLIVDLLAKIESMKEDEDDGK